MAEVKYYINYEDYLNVDELNKKIDLDSEDLKIVKKYKNGNVKITPILVFKGYAENFIDYVNSIKGNKKGISLMVELTPEEINLCNPLYIKKYVTYDKKNYELLPNEVKLISYYAYSNMTLKEINKGNIYKLVTLIPEEDKYYEIDQNDIITTDKSVFEIRSELAEKKVGCDIYFLTDDKEILEKYSNDITELKEVKDGIYVITKKDIIIIDSIPQTTVNDMTNETIRCLYQFCNKSIPVNIIEEDESYFIDSKKRKNYSKKGYMYIGTNLHSILYNSNVELLLKYINIYTLSDNKFRKINIEEYMKKNNILKYIKKPSKN